MNSSWLSSPEPYHSDNIVQAQIAGSRFNPYAEPQGIECVWFTYKNRLDELWPIVESAPISEPTLESAPVPTTITIMPDNIDQYRTGSYPCITKILWGAGPLNARVLRNFPSLKILGCSDTQLTSLAGLEGCPHYGGLKELHNSYIRA